MPEIWDRFVAAAAAWNVYGLPPLLALLAMAGGRLRDDLGRAARRLGAAHLALAAWSAVRVADELWAYRSMGIFPSNPVTGLFGSVLALACDLPVGLGLRRLRPGARVAAIALALARGAIGAIVARWTWIHGAIVDPSEWPRLALSYAFPAVALAVLLWPGMAGVFRGEPAVGRSAIPARLALAALAVAVSVAAVDAADALLRAGLELAGAGDAPA